MTEVYTVRIAGVTEVFFGSGQSGISDWSRILGLLKKRAGTAPEMFVCPFEHQRLATGENVALIHYRGRAQFCSPHCVPRNEIGDLGIFNTESSVDAWRNLLCETMRSDLREMAEEERLTRGAMQPTFAMA